MKKKHLVTVILWFAAALIWLILLIGSIYSQESIGMIVLRGLCAVMSLVSAILNLIGYRKAN